MINGKYSGKVLDACVGHSKAGALQVELLLGTADEQECSCFLSLSGKAMPYTIEKLKFLGLEDGKGPETIVGADVEWELVADEYQGKVTQRCNLYTHKGLKTAAVDRVSKAEAASILFPKAYVPPARRNGQREPGDDTDDLGF